jgi:DNA/RNA endonuclease YhcR with UshA esterase domain
MVYGYKALSGLTLVNLGAAYPDQVLTVVLKGEAIGIAAGLDGKTIKVTGKVEMYKGKPEIVVNEKDKITVQ